MNGLTKFQQVGVFHETFGHPINTTPQPTIFRDDPKLAQLRLDLIVEEYKELYDAYKTRNFIEMVDAICDILYVCYGALHVMGINYDTQNIGQPMIYSVTQYPHIDVFENSQDHLYDEMDMIKGSVTELQIHFKDLNNDDAFYNIVNSINKIISYCITLSTLLGVDIDKCFAEVQRSNMSKCCTTEEEAIMSVEKYSNQGIETNYRRSPNGEYWVIYNTKTNKILKSINFQQPDLKSIIFFV